MDVAVGAPIAANDNNAIGAIVPPSSTKDKDTHIGMLVAFEGTCIGAFVDGAGGSTAGESGGGGSLAPWDTRTMAAPVDSIVAGNVMVIAIVIAVVIVSHDVGAEGGVGGAVPPLLSCLLTLLAAALYQRCTVPP